ncbi:aldehyde dehydrogenase family protein [Bradyrhizobium sp. U87765 SZCCT0131]|uniref:aldehyde dehydrogenase family protein n=1 Tax=unclassified Bradyrhizobium TaxID=2631580 RepID=UPI001BA4B8FB|nr:MULTISPECIES: aldehyde dehydrogenase family protein [unclassified Bradyrhizobium]MBR1220918.1 aldehyde dehydrogenase family protein [Bradyrhizobium sp. U87765 SZCCT0131]MBR1260262.1 aldehyde dehydrogenase family protein [Bradyrhizobium sp. U87765 SZCCT0134]MBR1307489.1 aldehyde dehydrogenase family protein [Bradyrhizobium sp. U87765 SZCCT0110]MBR1321443.1 aldehyde dehydrogenase family protein [Bradyrhizobium sp. U87765 SZCCT0109]MBR1349756.1 aldehyde dehydrogenase family protein [Bradyrhizo
MPGYRLLIGGRLVDGDSSMDVIDPATEEVLAVCPRGSVAQMDAAVAAAKAAFPAWARRPIGERRAMLEALAGAIEAKQGDLARLLTQEQGKPLAEAAAEIIYTCAFIRHLSGLDLPVKVIEDNETRRVEQHRLPLGVVGAIIPWNFPVLIAAFKIPPALLAGNTVVIKPAPTTPLTTLKIGELMAGIFPAGVVNIVTDQNDLGGHLTQHPDVAKISFTGSSATGQKVMVSAASTLKRLTLELGGNDAAIVLPGADPEVVAPGIFGGAFMNAGQVCLAIKRAYVHESIYDDVVDRLAKLADSAVVDNGLQQGATIGPLQNRMQYEKVKTFLADAKADGRIVAGGEVEDRPGFFIRPTIVADIDDTSRLVREEQFGPILPVVKYSDPEDALTRANASPWGLGGSVWGKDREQTRDIALRMESGTAWINKHLDFGPNIPFGGAKQSGMGVEFAEEGLAEFTQIHIVNEAR